jgi:hypothetical protein
MTIENLQTQLSMELHTKMEKLRNYKNWIKTPVITRLLDSVEYLKDKHDASMTTYGDTYGISIYLTLKGLSGLKDPGLAALLDAFVHSNPDSTYSHDDAASFARSYTFYWYGPEYGEHRPSLLIAVTANFKEDSETCRRVITGYTEPSKEPTPIYELRCEEDKTEEKAE